MSGIAPRAAGTGGHDSSRPGCRLSGVLADTSLAFSVGKGRCVVGSLPGSDIFLPVRGVSRRHAALRWERAHLLVEDLASRNGTFVNGTRVQVGVLLPGDEVRFGPAALQVQEVAAGDDSLAIVSDREDLDEREAATEWVAHLENDTPGQTADVVRQLTRRLLGDVESHVATAFRLFGHHLQAAGGVLGEWSGQGEPHLLATFGALGTNMERRELYDFFTGVFADGARAACFRATVLGADPILFCCGFRRPGIDLLAMVLRGAPSPPRDGALAEVLLRLIDQARFRTVERDRQRVGSDFGRLALPLGYVRGSSPAMRDVYRQIEQLRHGEFPVLVQGETGVGKEHLVRLLHDASPRCHGPFVAINCAAIPSELLEAEMFGIARGVATGVQERRGRFPQAHGGTLFLDELGELSPSLQAKLLRAVESGQVQPVGGEPESVDVRIIAATNADLEQRTAAGRFRADLYYRLAGCVLRVPPLRERREDIPQLVEHFLGRFAATCHKHVRGVSVLALEFLVAHSWPGNVRQLENEMRRLVYLCPEGNPIDSDMLPLSLRADQPAPGGTDPFPPDLSVQAHVADLETRLIRAALGRSGGSRAAAARLLGLSRNGLATKMARHGLADV
jgi:DNA-binding NtrC family response regulator